MPALIDTALWYAETMGWEVLPLHTPNSEGACSCQAGAACKSAGKHPRTEHGSTGASRDKAQIKDWWREWPNANIGIAVGEESGVTVIDVDPRNGGRESLKDFIDEYGKVPDKLVAKTGGGGRHYYCAYDAALTIYKPASGIEIKSSGLVVVAPSLHESGERYQWISKPRGNMRLPSLPEWCLDTANEGSTRKSRTPKKPQLMPEGERDDMLVSYAGRWRRAGMEEPQLYAALSSLNKMWGEPPKDEDEVRRIARSVVRYPTLVETLRDKTNYPKGDRGHAERFLAKYGEDLRWTPGLGWMLWNGAFWKRDELQSRRRLAYYVGDTIREEATANHKDERDLRDALRDADYADSERGVSNMLKSAEALSAMDDSMYDFSPWLLNVQNGTIDLRTGGISAHSRTDFITKIAPVFYKAKAKAPRFEQFIQETFLSNQSLVDYMQRLLGYCLTGDVREQVFPVFWGETRNGKSTLIEHVIQAVMGKDYVTRVSTSTLVDKKYAGHPTELMGLRGARVAVAIESSKRRLDEEMIKQLTGGDMIRARLMQKDFIEFKPTHKLILVTNEKPRASTSAAIWRRLQLVPFENDLTVDQRDLELGDKLELETSGILNWMIDGCLAWQNLELSPPDKVKVATEEQRKSEDYIGLFIGEDTITGSKVRGRLSDLFDAYVLWCSQNGVRSLGKIMFSKELTARKYERYLSNGMSKFRGIAPKVVIERKM